MNSPQETNPRSQDKAVEAKAAEDKAAQPDNARFFDDVDVPVHDPRTKKTDTSDTSRTSAAPAKDAGQDSPTLSFSRAEGSTRPAAFAAPAPTQSPVTSAPATAEPTAVLADAAPATAVAAAPAAPASRGAVVAETSTTDKADKADRAASAVKRGTLDFGLLLLRVSLGLYFLCSGVSTFFTMGNSAGLSGLEQDFADYAQPAALAMALPTLQLVAGVFLLLGLVTPIAAMVATVAAGIWFVHAVIASGGTLLPWAWGPEAWLPFHMLALSLAVQFTGPGIIAIDAGRSWARRPLVSSWIFALLGIGALVAVVWFGFGIGAVR